MSLQARPITALGWNGPRRCVETVADQYVITAAETSELVAELKSAEIPVEARSPEGLGSSPEFPAITAFTCLTVSIRLLRRHLADHFVRLVARAFQHRVHFPCVGTTGMKSVMPLSSNALRVL